MGEELKIILSKIKQTEADFMRELEQCSRGDEFDKLRVDYLGRKGKVQSLFSGMSNVDQMNRPKIGAELNQLKKIINESLDGISSIANMSSNQTAIFDPSLPGRMEPIGSLHPLLQVLDEIINIFFGMGFRIEEGPQIESDYYNFEALNIPKHHPSRDMHDTFYLKGGMLLRTHTSPVQIRTMENQKPPIRMIAPGKCFRKDTPDASHSPIFNQVEGLSVDKNVSFADLKGIVQSFAQKLFGKDARVRFRPSFFPFTEPSAEYDFSCIFCKGKGCKVCKNTGWIEISGAGMVDPAVFGFVDYDPNIYTGYAFGMGVERIAMLKFEINDIRTFFENDIRFLEQF